MVGLEGEGERTEGVEELQCQRSRRDGGTSPPSSRPALDRAGPPAPATEQGKPRPTSSQDLVREDPAGNCCHLTAGSSVTDGFPRW